MCVCQCPSLQSPLSSTSSLFEREEKEKGELCSPDTVFCPEPYVLEQQIVSAGQVHVRPDGALGRVVAVEQQVLLPVAKADKHKGDRRNVKVYVVKEHAVFCVCVCAALAVDLFVCLFVFPLLLLVLLFVERGTHVAGKHVVVVMKGYAFIQENKNTQIRRQEVGEGG